MWVNTPAHTTQNGQQNNGPNDFTAKQTFEPTMEFDHDILPPQRTPPPPQKTAPATLKSLTKKEFHLAFMKACIACDFKVVKECLDLGLDAREIKINFDTQANTTCKGNVIHYLASADKRNTALQYVLEYAPDLLNLQDDVGDTALHYAALNKASKNAQTLVDAGADPRMQNHAGETVFDLAPKKNNKLVDTLKNAPLADETAEGFFKENNHTVSCYEHLNVGNLRLRKVFNFATHEITTLSQFGIAVQQFNEISRPERIKEAAEALTALKGNPGDWQTHKAVTPNPRRVK